MSLVLLVNVAGAKRVSAGAALALCHQTCETRGREGFRFAVSNSFFLLKGQGASATGESLLFLWGRVSRGVREQTLGSGREEGHADDEVES